MGIEWLHLRAGTRRKVCSANEGSDGSDKCHELPKRLARTVTTIGYNLSNLCAEVGMMTTLAQLRAARHRGDDAANLLFGARRGVMRYPNAVEEDVWILERPRQQAFAHGGKLGIPGWNAP